MRTAGLTLLWYRWSQLCHRQIIRRHYFAVRRVELFGIALSYLLTRLERGDLTPQAARHGGTRGPYHPLYHPCLEIDKAQIGIEEVKNKSRQALRYLAGSYRSLFWRRGWDSGDSILTL